MDRDGFTGNYSYLREITWKDINPLVATSNRPGYVVAETDMSYGYTNSYTVRDIYIEQVILTLLAWRKMGTQIYYRSI